MRANTEKECLHDVKTNIPGSREGQGHGDGDCRQGKAEKVIDGHSMPVGGVSVSAMTEFFPPVNMYPQPLGTSRSLVSPNSVALSLSLSLSIYMEFSQLLHLCASPMVTFPVPPPLLPYCPPSPTPSPSRIWF